MGLGTHYTSRLTFQLFPEVILRPKVHPTPGEVLVQTGSRSLSETPGGVGKTQPEHASSCIWELK